jgi:hypothetical protein
MQRWLVLITAFLLVMAWQYRKNGTALLVIVATLFADAALFVAGRPSLPEQLLKSLAIAWLICMLGAGVSEAEKLINITRKKFRKS